MARYRKVSTVIWNDQKFRALPDDAKLLFLFILTHPHMTHLGAMRVTLSGLAEELKWSLDRISKGYTVLYQNGMARLDKEAHCLLLPNFIKHNPPENPKVVLSWGKVLELIPECQLKNELIQLLKVFIDTLSISYREAFNTISKGYAIPVRTPDPDPEPEPEPELKIRAQVKNEKNSLAQKPDDVSQEVWDGFLQIRSKKRAPFTQSALKSTQQEAAKVGYTLEEALTTCQRRGWQGFESRYVQNKEEEYIS